MVTILWIRGYPGLLLKKHHIANIATPVLTKDLSTDDFPANSQFWQTLQTHFPGTLPLASYMDRTCQQLAAYGFEDANTMGMVAVCRDEIADVLFAEVIRRWGRTFNCGSLAGFVFMGRTGLAAATDHTPIAGGIRRFVFYAMPHIAISREGEIGKVYRDGIQKISHACGALEAIATELRCGHLKLEMDMEDIEQTLIRQKILSTLDYGEKPDLIAISKLACEIISQDVTRLLQTLDHLTFHYALMTGILIHGPLDTHWVYPQTFYLMGADPTGVQTNLEWELE